MERSVVTKKKQATNWFMSLPDEDGKIKKNTQCNKSRNDPVSKRVKKKILPKIEQEEE